MREIVLTRGQVAIVDDEDFEAVSAFKWCAQPSRHTFYALRNVRRPGGGKTTENLHRLVLARKLGRPLLNGEKADHENGDGLDNRREKLRLATNAQNMRNCFKSLPNKSSQFLGVARHRATKKWQASIRVPGKSIYLGLHDTELGAAQSREAYILAHPS